MKLPKLPFMLSITCALLLAACANPDTLPEEAPLEAADAIEMPCNDPTLIKDALDGGGYSDGAGGIVVNGVTKYPVLVGSEWFLDDVGLTISERVCELIAGGTIAPEDSETAPPFSVQWNGMVFCLAEVNGTAHLIDP